MGQLALFELPAPTLDGANPSSMYASYSADLIATMGKVRRPLSHNGALWVCVGCGGRSVPGAMSELQMYRLEPADNYDGPMYTYVEKTCIWHPGDKYTGDFARNDPRGFYGGMLVKTGGKTYAMCEPQKLTVSSESLRAAWSCANDEDAEDDDAELYENTLWDGEDYDDDGFDERTAAA